METKAWVFLILTIVFTSSTAEFISFNVPDVKDNICNTSGLSCVDCWTSVNCIDLGGGDYYPQLITCPLGRSCRNDTGFCESEGFYDCSNPENERVPCQSEGYFPDPFDCRKYFICILRQDGTFDKHVRYCSRSQAFDPFVKKCKDESKNERHCISPVPICKGDFDSGPVAGNSNFFYICQRANVTVGYNYVPRIYECPEDFNFNGTSCVDPKYSGLNENDTCIEVGRFATNRCDEYNDCTVVGNAPVLRSCGGEQFKFDIKTKSCLRLNCVDCRY